MGFGSRKVKFIGHGIGLNIDEYPVIAEGFFEPLEEGMVIALEPKKGIEGIGMVGVENTFIVTPEGGKCITGDNRPNTRITQITQRTVLLCYLAQGDVQVFLINLNTKRCVL